MEKICCTSCKIPKPATHENFHYKNKKKKLFRTICRPCWKVYHHQHYIANKAKYIEKAEAWDLQFKRKHYPILNRYKRIKGCIDCPEHDPIVLEFDHISGTKTKSISKLMTNCNWPVIKTEIKKCVVRCCNCHRRRTAKQFMWRH